MNLKEAFDMNRRGFLKGAASAAAAGGIAGKAVASVVKPGAEGTLHHHMLKKMGWKQTSGFDHAKSIYMPGTAQYTHPKLPGHEIHVQPDDEYGTSWSHQGAPHEETTWGDSAKELHGHLSKLSPQSSERSSQSKPKSKTSNWGRAGKIAKGKPSQAKPSVTMKEAFLMAEAIKLMHKGESNGFHFYHFQADNKVKGHIWAEPDGKKLHIHNIATNHNKKQGKPNAIGHKNMRDIFRGLKQHHPEAEHVTGIRVSGARPDASQSRVVANLKKI